MIINTIFSKNNQIEQQKIDDYNKKQELIQQKKLKMETVNEEDLIERESFVPNSKNIPAKNDSIVFDGLKLSFVNYIDTVTKWPIYNASHWVNNIDRWHNNLNNTKKY